MSSNDEKFTFLWCIENHRYSNHKKGDFLKSPIFTLEKFFKTKWHLIVYLEGCEDTEDNFVSCFLYRGSNDGGPDDIEIYFELSSNSENFGKHKYTFKGGSGTGFKEFLSLSSEEITQNKSFLIKCQISSPSIYSNTLPKNLLPVAEADSYSSEIGIIGKEIVTLKGMTCIFPQEIMARSRILIEKFFFSILLKENIFDDDLAVFSTASCTKIPSLLTILTLSRDDKCGDRVNFDIKLLKGEISFNLFVVCKISLLNSYGITEKIIKDEHLFIRGEKFDVWHFDNFFNISDLKLNNENYLYPQSLEFEFEFSSGRVCHEILWVRDKDQKSELFNGKISRGKASKEKYNFYREGKFCDVSLRCKNQTFDAHKIVICAHSPVLKAMFENNMKESNTNVVDISDLDAETAKEMLFYMYNETVNELNFEIAKKLFSAADEYLIFPLKVACGEILRTNLKIENICSIWLLADIHQDFELKNHVITFFTTFKSAILLSPGWKDFMDKNVLAANKILLELLLN